MMSLSTQMQETNVHVAKMTAAIGRCANAMDRAQGQDEIVKAVGLLASATIILADDTSRMTTACGQMTAALDHLTEAVEAQTSTFQTVFQGATLTQQELSRQLHWQGTQFRSLRSLPVHGWH